MAESLLAMEGSWVEERCLGVGGFGQVTLWKNSVTGKQIAVKKCRSKNDMKPTHRQRWKLEVNIMTGIDHENIVRAFLPPDQLAPPESDPVILVMEYCQGGDLRQVITSTPCGMKEPILRHLVQHVARGVEYLHKKRIIHRDLKPENIVISKQGPREMDIVYKIIDLGYAKELSETSVCNSFVGTMQYLAPELMSQKAYTRTVDFWSFGVMIFECITGLRPFLPSEAPVRWHEHVSRKSEDDICLYYNVEGNVVGTSQLLQPNHLCRTSRAFFEQFLRLMLKWNPKQRGGKAGEQGQRDKCWCLLDNILNSPLLYIYCVPTNKVLTYPVEERHCIHDVQKALERETRIPLDQQELLRLDGTTPDLRTKAKELCGDGTDDEIRLYLFRHYTTPESPVLPGAPDDKWPEFVQYMIHEPSSVLNHTDQVSFMSQAAYACAEKARITLRIHQASRAALTSLMRSTSEFNKQRGIMMNGMATMSAVADMCEAGFAEDISNYESQPRDSQISSKKTLQSWKDMKIEMNTLKEMHKEVEILNQECQMFQSKMIELQRNPHLAGKVDLNDINRIAMTALQLYKDLRKKPKADEARKPVENKDMLAYVCQANDEREKQTAFFYDSMRQLMAKKNELRQLTSKVNSMMKRVEIARKRVKECQLQRQKDMWKLLNFAINKGQTCATASSITGTSPAMQTSMFLTQRSLDTFKILSNHDNTKKKVRELLGGEAQSDDEPSMGSSQNMENVDEPSSS